eukprot:scaffold53209_cov62-Phaeocystis_antarctica.AAC.6
MDWAGWSRRRGCSGGPSSWPRPRPQGPQDPQARRSAWRSRWAGRQRSDAAPEEGEVAATWPARGARRCWRAARRRRRARA